jgi:hypothetical protein
LRLKALAWKKAFNCFKENVSVYSIFQEIFFFQDAPKLKVQERFKKWLNGVIAVKNF